jgi:uncharacterized membrane protein
MTRVALLLLVACAEAPVPIDEYPCPPQGTALTYDSFGRAFMSAHCNNCHNASEGKRSGAPESYRFDTLDDVRAHADRIFVRAATSNTTMPPGPEDPSADTREQLAEWLACGAP